MKSTLRKMLVVLAIVAVATAVPTVWAADCTETVEGTITSVGDVNTIVVDGITIKGVSFTYLANQHNIVLVEDVTHVVVTAHLCLLSDDKVRACSISVDGGAVIDLPGK